LELKGKKVLVVGLGKSGAAAAQLCLARGARVIATDQADDTGFAAQLAGAGAELHLGGHRPEDFTWAEVVVLSPGVDQRLPEVMAAKQQGSEVLGELELGCRFLNVPSVMITGTNGKSTVTTLIGRMLEAAGKRVFLGGNLGTPLCEFVSRDEAVDWAVLEVSSFQLDTASTMRPKVGVLLNVSPDHLDRYDNAEEYVDSKFSLFRNQGSGDVAVLCLDDPIIAARKDHCPAQVWGYAAQGPVEPGGWLLNGDLIVAAQPGTGLKLSAKACKLHGHFNRLNLLAASLAALAAGADTFAVQSAMDSFQGLPHRLELVEERDGVRWFDDSKGTNVGAVIAALEALATPTVLLLGGRDKEGNFGELGPQLHKCVQQVICFGEAGPAIHGQISALADSRVAPGLPEAVELARESARPGQAVLLSPGCASFDAYTGYAQRGEHFKALVKGQPWDK
jgi:UDP-N-acetylmuramoylalanine--D-glutamate ligase